MKKQLQFYLIPGLLLMSIFSSCGEQKTPQRSVKVDEEIVYVKKTFMKPFSGYEIKDGKVHLSSPYNNVLPAGQLQVALEGTCPKGDCYLIFERDVGDQQMNYTFDFNDLDRLGINQVVYSKGKDSIRSYYDMVIKFIEKRTLYVTVFYELPAICEKVLPNPESKVGFQRHFSQEFGGRNRILIRPYIRLNSFLLTDLRKKGLIREDQKAYCNDGTGTAYRYRKISDLN